MAHNGITEVGKYRVIEQVGEGAMGVVYRALDPVLNRAVAIKVMSDALARDDDLRSRFLREAQAAGSLQHPNVITIYDFGEVGGHLYIAMEFVAGSDLEDTLRGGTPLSIVQKIDILVDVLNGLGYAHKRGVVHRDIKPANIRIDEEGRARIMDFGIAHLQSSTLTRSGLMVGTPAYMAPEQVSGGAISAQTDIFSVGAMMYELFTGSKPFEGESLQSVFYKIVTQPPLDFSAVAPGLPASLNRIVMRALAKAPADRYPSAADMANELSEARGKLDRVSSMPTRVSLNSSLTTGLSTRSTKPMPVVRDRSRIIAASVGAVAVVASVGIFIFTRPRESEVPPVTTPTPAITEAPAPTTPVPTPQVTATPPVTQSAAPATSPKTPDRPATKTERPAPTAQELSLFRSLQTATLESRRRAGDAGANAEQLRAGDDHNTLANASLQQGRMTEAMAHLNLAGTAWTSAERDARSAAAAAAAAASQAKTRAAESKQQDAPPAIPPPATTTPATTVVVPPPVSSPRPVANPIVEIEAVVVAYERAIETRDIAELRRAYPGMTTAQTKGWEDFFKTLRSIQASLSPSGIEVRGGDAADARITGAYDYVTTAGKSVRQPVNFQASFRREGGAWRLIAVR